MDAPMPLPHFARRKPHSALIKLTIYALLCVPVLFTYLQLVLLQRIEMPLPIFSVIALLLAAVIAGYPLGGWRWTPILGALWCSLMIGGNLDHIISDLQRPDDTHLFAFVVVLLAAMTVGAISGFWAALQNYRSQVHVEPRSLPLLLSMLAALAVGSISTAAIPQANVGIGVDPNILATLPAVSTSSFTFSKAEIFAKVGETVALRLDNHDSVGHSFDVDELNVHAAMPSGNAGLALFKPTQPGTYTFYCAIPGHADKATGTGMIGRLVITQ